MADRIAMYPGSFDPPTYGHLDIIQRASKVFDKVIVAVAHNTEKSGLFTVDERIEMLKDITGDLGNVSIGYFTGLTVDYARDHGVIVLIRGLRAVSDFEYELTMAATNRRMYPECDTISFMPSEQYMFISSRLVKEIAQLGGDVSHFVPPTAVARLHEKIGNKIGAK